MSFIEDSTVRLGILSDRLSASMDIKLDNASNRLAALSGVLNSLSPLAVLSRGYGAVTGSDGAIIKSASSVSEGEKIRVSLRDGVIGATVNEIEGGSING